MVRSPSENGFGSPVTLLPRLISFHPSLLSDVSLHCNILNIRRIMYSHFFLVLISIISAYQDILFQILQLHRQVPSKALNLGSHHHAPAMLGASLRRGQRPGQRISSLALSMISLSWGDAWAREARGFQGRSGPATHVPRCFTGQATVYECTRVRTEKKYAVPWTTFNQGSLKVREGSLFS